MRYYFHVAQHVHDYGRLKFYDAVREVLVQVLETSRLTVSEYDIRRLYEDFATAYIIGVKSRNPELFKEMVMTVAYDENTIPGTTVESISFLSTQGTEDQHILAIGTAADILICELESQTGLAGLINSMFPGQLENWSGESFSELVIICYDTLYGSFGSVLSGPTAFAS